MLLPPLECPEADMPHPHITVMRPEAGLSMRGLWPQVPDAARGTHAWIQGFLRMRCGIKWVEGAWLPQEAASPQQETMTTTTRWRHAPYVFATIIQHLNYLYLFNQALNKYIWYNIMISGFSRSHWYNLWLDLFTNLESYTYMQTYENASLGSWRRHDALLNTPV